MHLLTHLQTVQGVASEALQLFSAKWVELCEVFGSRGRQVGERFILVTTCFAVQALKRVVGCSI